MLDSTVPTSVLALFACYESEKSARTSKPDRYSDLSHCKTYVLDRSNHEALSFAKLILVAICHAWCEVHRRGESVKRRLTTL